jgi:hypothetical protein
MNTGGLLQVCGVRIFSCTRRVHMSCILYPQHSCNTQGSFITYIRMKFVSSRILNTVCQWHQLAGFLWHNLRILNWKSQNGRWLVNYQGLSRVILEVQSGFVYEEGATNEKFSLIYCGLRAQYVCIILMVDSNRFTSSGQILLMSSRSGPIGAFELKQEDVY